MKKKILIQIPSFNEEHTLSDTVNDIRKNIKKFKYEILVIDDGSTDNTVKVATKLKVNHIIIHTRNLGLAKSFQSGINFAKKNNFDFLINTDADNQYKSEYIDILYNHAILTKSDIVIGSRQFSKIQEFSFLKKFFQIFGSFVVSVAAGQKIKDAVSGFRIYNKTAINKIFVTSNFSYTIDVLIQSIDHNLLIDQIPIETNKPTRDSRLFKGIFNFIIKQSGVLIKTFIIYRPFQFFSLLGAPSLIISIFIFIRFLILNIFFQSSGHIQSLILGLILIMFSFIMFSIGIVGLLIKHLRLKIDKN